MRMAGTRGHAGRERSVRYPPFHAPPPSARMGGYAPRWSATSKQRPVKFRYSGNRFSKPLAELDRNVRVAVGSDRPGRRDVAIWAQDVGLVLGAVHEHGVELRVVHTP